MRNLSFTRLMVFSFVLLLILPTVASGKRVALVIGNGDYKDTPLKNPVNDAVEMARSLEQLGFSVIQIHNADLRKFHEGVNQFYTDLTSSDIALFFYAGHGVQYQGENYLLPIETRVFSLSDIRYEAFHVGRLIDRLEEASTMNIIILDACRNNPFGRGFSRSLDRGLNVISHKPEGTFIAYATAPGKTADDGDGENGLFTSAMLRHMDTDGIEISELLRRVRSDVKKESSGRQVPWSESSLTEEFYFKPESLKNEPHVEALQDVQDDSEAGHSHENLFWESIKDSNDPSDYEAYIQQFPNGVFKPLAKLRITKYSQAENSKDAINELTDDNSQAETAVTEEITTKVRSTGSKKGKLLVKTTPDNARVRILNIKPKYTHDMELVAGRYHIEVSASGHVTKKHWIHLSAGEMMTVEVTLKKKQTYTDPKTGIKFQLVE